MVIALIVRNVGTPMKTQHINQQRYLQYFKVVQSHMLPGVLETNSEQGSSLMEHNGTATNDEHNDSDEPRIHEEYDDTDEPTIY